MCLEFRPPGAINGGQNIIGDQEERAATAGRINNTNPWISAYIRMADRMRQNEIYHLGRGIICPLPFLVRQQQFIEIPRRNGCLVHMGKQPVYLFEKGNAESLVWRPTPCLQIGSFSNRRASQRSCPRLTGIGQTSPGQYTKP